MRSPLNPNASIAWEQRGWTYQLAGQPEEAIRSFERAIRLSPFDPWLFSTFTGMGIAFIGLGRFDEAVAAAKKALRQNQTFSTSLIAALRRPWLIWDAKQKRRRQWPVCSNSNPIFAFLNG